MKNILMLFSVLAMLTMVSCGDTTKDAADKAKSSMTGKDHVCNDDCKEGKCNFVCGEKGHECSDSCHADKKEAKAHTCTDACKEGECSYACGEKGHTCTSACKV